VLRVVRLAPWRRAPRLLWRFPAVWWSFAGVGAVLALAFAVPPLYLATAASSSVADQERGRCSWAAGLQAAGSGVLSDRVDPATAAADVATPMLESAGRAVLAADGRRGHLSPPLTTLIGGPIDLLPGPGHEFAETEMLLYRDRALENIKLVGRVPGDGFVLTEGEAKTLGLTPGSALSVRGDDGSVVRAPVVGIYRDLAKQPRQPFWCSLDTLIHQRDPLGNSVPPPLLLATSSDVMVDLLQRLNPIDEATVGARFERALEPDLRLDQAESALAVVQAALATAPTGAGAPPDFPRLRTEVPFIVERAHAVRHALGPPVTALAAGAAAACLGLVALAGSFWTERRRTELDVLSVRGAGAAGLAVKAALECALPLLTGLAVGTAASFLVVRVVGPDGSSTPASARVAVLLGLLAWVLSLAVLAVGVAWQRRAPRASRTKHRHRSAVVFGVAEVIALVAAVTALGKVTSLPQYEAGSQLPTFGLARLLLPLLVLACVAAVCVRLVTTALPFANGRADGWRTAPLLALQRLAALPRVPGALMLAVAVATGTCVYATSVADSLQRTVEAKANVFVGSDTAVELRGKQPVPPVHGRLTQVFQLPDTFVDSSNPQPVRVLAVDPVTFADVAYWQPAFADSSLPELMRRLPRPVGGRLPAIAVGAVPDDATVLVPLNATNVRLPLVVRARPSSFPGKAGDPLVVVSEPALRAAWPDALRFATQTLWLREPTASTLSQLGAAGLQARYITTVASVSAVPSLEAVLETLDILRALGVLGAALALIGLAVYVDVRSRRRRLAAVLTRRMGLRPTTEWLSNWLELSAASGLGVVVGAITGIGLGGYVTGLLDPLPGTPPGPLVVRPLALALALAATAVVGTAVVAALTQRHRTIPDAAVLRAE
jgi:hypothetical protein